MSVGAVQVFFIGKPDSDKLSCGRGYVVVLTSYEKLKMENNLLFRMCLKMHQLQVIFRSAIA